MSFMSGSFLLIAQIVMQLLIPNDVIIIITIIALTISHVLILSTIVAFDMLSSSFVSL